MITLADRTLVRSRIQFRIDTHRSLLDITQVGAGERVAVMCTGTGLDALLAAERVGPHGHVLAIDNDPRALQLAADRLRNAAADVRIVRADAAQPPVAPASVDAVVCAFGLHYFPQPLDVLRRWMALLAPGGRLGLTWWERPDPSEVFAALRPPELVASVLEREVGVEVTASRVVTGPLRYRDVDHFVATLAERPDLAALPSGAAATVLRQTESAARAVWSDEAPVEQQRVRLLELRQRAR